MVGVNRGVAVWLVAFAAYFVAVFNRSSLAVAGLLAAERFGISAAELATFTVLQLLVYALMQVPVGLLIDRWGPRAIILTGAAVLAVGQGLFAWADSYGWAVAARVLVGMGDALTFICLLRFTATWVPTRRVGLMTTLSGSLGQLGAIVAAVPMTWALSNLGWTKAYLSASIAGVVLVVVGLFVLRDTPDQRSAHGESRPMREVISDLGQSWRNPGTKLAFWTHFTTPFGLYAFTMLWGLPFLVKGQELSEHAAGVLISVVTASAILGGPVLGWLMGYQPWHRSTLALGIVAANAVSWGVVLAWPGPSPIWLLTILCLVLGLGGPASMIGFDVARTFNPPAKLASAAGITNQGGFIAALILVLGIGWVLDWKTPGGGTDYTLEGFRWAFSIQYLLWAVGCWQIWRYRILARKAMPRDVMEASRKA